MNNLESCLQVLEIISLYTSHYNKMLMDHINIEKNCTKFCV